VVTFEDKLLSRSYVEETSFTWPLIIDESRELYRSYGMLSASFWDIWGPRTWLAYLREIIKGQKLKKSDLKEKNEAQEKTIRINTVISTLDEVTNDPNIPMYSRTQIWNIVSALEAEQQK